MVIKTPCRHCEARSGECHTTCDLYLEYKEATNKQKAYIYKQREIAYAHRDLICSGRERYRKRVR